MDRALAVDQGDAPAGVQAEGGGIEPFVNREGNRFGPPAVSHPKGHGLILVGDIVDQARVPGLVALEKRPVDERPDFLRSLFPGFGDRRNVIVEAALQEGLHHLAVGRSEAGFGELVVRRLEFLDVLEFSPDSNLVQPFFEEGDESAQAVDADPAEGVEDDPVAARRQVIFLIAFGEFLQVGDGLLSGAPEVEDGLADLGALGPIAFQKADLQKDPLDPPVDLGHP